MLTNCLAIGNQTGVSAESFYATLWLAHSTVVGNTTGYSASSSAVINSFGDNYIAGNGSNTGSLSPATKQ